MVPEISGREPLVLIKLTFSPEIQVPPTSPRTSIGPNTPRSSRIPFLLEQPYQTSDVQQTSHTVKGRAEVLSKIDKAKQLVKNKTAV